MKDKTLPTVVASIVLGVLITLTSGLFRTPLERMGVDAVRSGLPLVWSMRVIPRAVNVDWGSFFVDIVFWTLMGLVALSTAAHLVRKRTTQGLIRPEH